MSKKITIELSEEEWEELKRAHVNYNFKLWNARGLLFGVCTTLGDGGVKDSVRNAFDLCGEAIEHAGGMYDALIVGYVEEELNG